jgi:hypothetical protein
VTHDLTVERLLDSTPEVAFDAFVDPGRPGSGSSNAASPVRTCETISRAAGDASSNGSNAS